MKRFFLLFVFLLTLSTVGAGQGTGPLTVTDNTRTCNNCRKIVFSTITVSGNTATVSGGGGGSGDVVGPASATDNAVARFNLTTGKLIQNSVVTIGDTGNTTGIANLTFTGVLTGGSAPTTITDSAGKILSAALNTVQPAQGGTGITALGTGIATALGVNIGSAGAPVLFNGAGGTPSSLTLTNGTGLPISTGVSGLGTGVAAWLATPSSANLDAALTDKTGSGLAVFATSPTLTTPVLGVATATSINKVALTVPATSATLTIANGKTLTASNTLTFTGTDASSVAFGAGGTVAYTSNNLSAFAATTSAQLAGVLSDETGSGLAVFGTSPTLTTPTISGAISFPDDVRQAFNPGTTNAGLNVGSLAGDPSTPSNGDLWYDSTANELTARINGANVALGAGGGGGGITVGTTTVTSGTATRLFYETAGNVVGQISGATSDGTTVTLTSPTVNTGITLNAAPLTMSGNISSAAWTTNGLRIKGVAATFTDTTSSGTVAAAYTNALGGNTIAASSSTTYTDYYTTFMTQPTAGSNVTFTRRWALGLSGAELINVSSANAFTVGPNGPTNPTFNVVTNVASAATGLSVTGNAAGSGVTLTVLSSGSNEDIILSAKGTGKVNLPSSGSKTITTSGNEFVAEATGDSLGTVRFKLRNRSGSAGGVFENAGLDLVDMAFVSTLKQYNLRMEGRSSSRKTANSTGELQAFSNVLNAQVAGFGDAFSYANNFWIGSATSTSGSIGTSGVGVLAIANGTAPSSSPADEFQLYSADSAAGDANAFARNEAGEINRLTGLAARNSSSFAKTSDTTLANITGLTRNVEAGRTYYFETELSTTSANTGGVKFAISGTATATAIDYEGVLRDGTTISAATRATALDTTVCAVTAVTAATCRIRGVLVVGNAGTITVQFAQNTSDAGASTVLVNQAFSLRPIS